MSRVTNNDLSTPNNTLSLDALPTLVPSNVQSRISGGTADILPMERKKATFDVNKLTTFLDGGKKNTKRRRFIISPNKDKDVSDRYYWNRSEHMKKHLEHFFEVHEEYAGKIIPSREDVAWMQEFSMIGGTMMNHYGLFLPTIVAQASADQQSEWLWRAIMMKMIGAYAQTELGHGSNVRGLQTLAVYDKKTQEFVLSTPTLQSMKWWPGTLGKVKL
jgi:acyl-CoA oxidase